MSNQLYPAIEGSPQTELVSGIGVLADEIEVKDGNALPDAPNIMTIQGSSGFEIIKYLNKEGNLLTNVERGVGGTAQAWIAGTKCARMFTAYDHNALINGIQGGGARAISFIIAPSDAVNKERADLILTGVPADDRAAIQQAIEDLHTARGEDTDIAIRIDFLGGNIDVGTKTDGSGIIIPLGYDNIHLYGNGVKITGNIADYNVLKIESENCILDGFDVNNLGDFGNGISAYNSTLSNCSGSGEYGIYATNSTLSNCSGSGEYAGISAANSTLSNCSGSGRYGIEATSSTLSNCSGSGGDTSISATNSTLSNCSGSGAYAGIYASGSILSNCSGSGNEIGISANNASIVYGCDGTDGGIYISSDSLPSVREIAENLNKGVITIEGEV